MGSFFGETPKVETQAPQTVEKDASKAKLARKALFATEGGQKGQELQVGEVAKRESLFGN